MILHFFFTDVGRPLVEGLQRGSWLSLTQCICEMGAGAGIGNPNAACWFLSESRAAQ